MILITIAMKITARSKYWIFLLLIVQLSCCQNSLDSEIFKNNLSATYLIFDKEKIKIINASTPTLVIEYAEMNRGNKKPFYQKKPGSLWPSIPDSIEVERTHNLLHIKPPFISGDFRIFEPDDSWDSIKLKRVVYGKTQFLESSVIKSNNTFILADMILDPKANFLDTINSSLDGYFEYLVYDNGTIRGRKITGSAFTCFTL